MNIIHSNDSNNNESLKNSNNVNALLPKCSFCSRRDSSIFVVCVSRCLMCSKCTKLLSIRKLLIDHHTGSVFISLCLSLLHHSLSLFLYLLLSISFSLPLFLFLFLFLSLLSLYKCTHFHTHHLYCRTYLLYIVAHFYHIISIIS